MIKNQNNKVKHEVWEGSNIRRLRKVVIILFTSFSGMASLSGQSLVMEPDSVNIDRSWVDKNGHNKLTISVYAACNPEKPPYDGHKSKIEATLINEKHKLQVIYDEENYEMQMILIEEDKISYYDLKGNRAVLIPFFHCGTYDNIVIVHYIILYNKESYLLKIRYNQEHLESMCVLNDDPKEVAKDILTPKLRRHFIKQVKEKYDPYENF